MLADRIAARHAARAEQILRRQQHRGRAEAALQRVALAECLLEIGDRAGIGHALDRLHARAVALDGEREAAAHDHIVETDRAGAAHAVLAADMTAGEPERVAQEIDQRRARLDRLGDGFAVHSEPDVDGAHARDPASCAAARRSSTPARCFFTAPVAWMSSGGSRSSALTASSIEPPPSAASAFLARTGVSPTPK